LDITTVVNSAGQSLHTFCHRWRDTNEMSLKSSETADGRVIGRGECIYPVCRQLKTHWERKLTNVGSFANHPETKLAIQKES